MVKVRRRRPGRRWIFGAVLLLTFLLTVVSFPLVAVADGGAAAGPDSMLPAPPLPVDQVAPPLYERFPISHYTLNGDYGVTHPGYAIANGFLSGLFMFSAYLAKWVIRGLQFAFTLSIFKPLSPVVDQVIASLRDSIWLPFLTTAILIVAGWAVWTGMIRRRYSEVWGTVATSLLLIVAAVWVFEHMGTTLTKMNDYSSIVSGRVLTAGSSWDSSTQVQPGDSLEVALNKTITAAGNSMWKNFVVYPWAVANFGSIETASKPAYALDGIPGGKFLAVDANGRTDLYRDNGNGWMSSNPDFAMWQPDSDALGSRFVIVLMTLIATLVYAILMLLVAGAVLFFQMLALFWAFWAPVVFLLGLVPGWGPRIVEKWAMRLAGALAMKIGLAFLFAVIMVIASGIYAVANQIAGGWVMGMVLQVLLLVGLWFYRNKLTDLFSSLGAGAVTRARAVMEHGSEEHQAGRAFRRAPILAATNVKAALGQAREVYEQRQARAWAHKRLDQRVKTDKAYKDQVQDRIRQGMNRYTPDEIQGQMRFYEKLKAEGQDPQRALLKPVEAGTEQGYVEAQTKFDQEMAEYRQVLDERERTYKERAKLAVREKSGLGRFWNRRRGTEAAPAAGTPTGGPGGGPGGPAPQNPPPSGGGAGGVVVPFQRQARPARQRPSAQQIPKAIRSPSSANRNRPMPGRVTVDGAEQQGQAAEPVALGNTPSELRRAPAARPQTARAGAIRPEAQATSFTRAIRGQVDKSTSPLVAEPVQDEPADRPAKPAAPAISRTVTVKRPPAAPTPEASGERPDLQQQPPRQHSVKVVNRVGPNREPQPDRPVQARRYRLTQRKERRDRGAV